MRTDLIEVKEIIKQLESTSSSNEKIKIIKKNKDNELFKKVLIYTYDKNLKFKVSKKSIKPRDGKSKWNDLFEMLDELSQSNINNDLKINVNRFLGSIEDEEIRDLVIKILLKDLKCNISVKSINKAIQGLIFDFQVMKASAYNDKTKEGFIKKARKQGYIMSIKRNGERGEVIKENGKIIIKSRQNKLYENLVDLEKAFEDMPDNTFYEGELLAFNPNGEEWKTSEDQFKLTNKILHTDGEKHGIYIELFDMIPLEDFKNGESKIKAKDRRKNIDELVDEVDNELIHKAETIYQGTNTDLIQEKLEEVSDCSKHEGLMIILNDSIYESKRVNYHLKVKLFNNIDLRVVDIEESKEIPNTMGSAIVLYKGKRVGVSGWKQSEKEYYWKNKNELIGKIIEIKYKSITVDKEGKESLQFPNIVRIRYDKDEESYE